MSRTFASRTFASRTFAARTWSGRASGDPTDGWKSCEFNRVALATSINRVVVSCELSRVVWAKSQGK